MGLSISLYLPIYLSIYLVIYPFIRPPTKPQHTHFKRGALEGGLVGGEEGREFGLRDGVAGYGVDVRTRIEEALNVEHVLTEHVTSSLRFHLVLQYLAVIRVVVQLM